MLLVFCGRFDRKETGSSRWCTCPYILSYGLGVAVALVSGPLRVFGGFADDIQGTSGVELRCTRSRKNLVVGFVFDKVRLLESVIKDTQQLASECVIQATSSACSCIVIADLLSLLTWPLPGLHCITTRTAYTLSIWQETGPRA